MDRTQYNRIGRQIVWIIILANGLGAMLISIYYVVIAPLPQGDAPVVQSTPLSFLPTILGTSFLLILGTLMVRYAQRYTPRWSEFLLKGGDPEELPLSAQREVLNLVPWITFTTLTMWLLAGLFMSDFPENWRGFLVTLGVGGVLTTAIVFLAAEIAWRPAIPFFFPKGQLRTVRAVRISVLTRLVIVFLLITLYPAGLLTLVAFDRATVLLTAPNPQAVLQNMLVGIVFILVISLVASLGMAFLVARLIVHPLNGLEEAMQKVEQGQLEVSVPVYSNDELGYLAERFNEMILGLKRAELLRTLLNLYVSPEVARNAVEHGTALGGQVVECTVLFSDIRGFTSLSETLSPTDLIDLLNRYMSAMVEVIVSQGGMVNKFGGDSLLAVFGTPLNPSPKHAARAVRAAQGMFTALAQFN
ncbi:MAG TPA: adenylate/guanylate cyclase domain-containing protein, partial [Anaerolineales bacterium]|nr:adenylate/guanylate cyclase domain-containing protein [Anaerolineales bacterium]